MGQKVNPISFRLGVSSQWDSIWFSSSKNYANNLKQDVFIREYIQTNLKYAFIARVVIKRKADSFNVTIHSARPGLIIGKRGIDIEKLKNNLSKIVDLKIDVDIVEVKKPEISASLIATSIANQLEKRMLFRKVIKKAAQGAMRYGAQGVRINCSGRLGGAEIARMEWHREGRVPLHTLRAKVDYAVSEARTNYGVVGIKVWVYRGGDN